MSGALYMDVQVPAAITRGLRRRGVDALTAQEDGTARLEDPALLDRATALGRIIFTRDRDFLAEAVRRQRAGLPFATVVYARQLRVSIGHCVEDLEIIFRSASPDETVGHIIFLPL